MADLTYSKVGFRVLSEQSEEKQITEYKQFYKNHLSKLRYQKKILQEFYPICIDFFGYKVPSSSLIVNKEKLALEIRVEKFLSAYFSDEILNFFKKKLPRQNPSVTTLADKPMWTQLLMGLLSVPEELNKHEKKEWQYKVNFLFFLYNCLYDTGLHSLISKRKPEIYKRYNLVIEHDFKSRSKQHDHKTLIGLDKLQEDFLTPYQKKSPILINGKLIPLKNICKLTITSTLLLNDEIELFAVKKNFSWSHSAKDELSFANSCDDETDAILKNPFLSTKDSLFRNKTFYFVDPDRIKELVKIKSSKFDIVKLIELCKELNTVSAGGNTLSSSFLVRAIIDHIPPIFKCNNFAEVANNYSGGAKSFKKAMITLHNSLRNIADNNIHTQIRNKEVLPTMLQSDFTPELDLLLSEIVRVLK